MLPHYTYRLSFQYRTVRGIPPRFAVDYDGGKAITELNSKVLDSSEDWRTYTEFIVPKDQLTKAELLFIAHSNNNDLGTVVEFKNIVVHIDQAPELVWYRDNHPKILVENPSLTINKSSPVEYTVLVKNAQKPFTLIFNQSFQKGWEVSIDGEKIDNSKHFLVNGYANGWDIDKTGDYTIRVVYAPQKLLLIGVGVTVLIIVMSVVAYIVMKRRHAR